MTPAGYILAIDQGTTGTTALLVDGSGRVVWQTSQEIEQIYPQPGWVEHDPEDLFDSCLAVVDELLEDTETDPRQIEAVGIANQRETTLVWDRETGEPMYNAVVWQCRRSAPLCEAMKAQGLEAMVRARTGLPIDAYFSATKLRWLLDAIPNGQRRAESGELAFGTVDSWLLWKLTNGAIHATDTTNASRTMLYDIDRLKWDPELLSALDIPVALLPKVRPSSGVFGHTSGELFRGQGVPIAGMAGDQHAALFGQACFQPGMVKNTYGTGSFVLTNTGANRVQSGSGMISTIAWQVGDEVTYALEGSIFATGSTVQWLRDGLGLIAEASETDALARTVPDNGGVYLVPAFTGLGTPHWDMDARGAILGITRGTTRGHFARAALESTAYQTKDVVEAISKDTGQGVSLLRVDGGGTASELMMQFQADILGIPTERSAVPETTALGAAYLAGLAVGFWNDLDEIADHWRSDARFEPAMVDVERERLYLGWQRAVLRTLRRVEVAPAPAS
ncbi:MAG TPA: glycerol kinase [Gemmatimonadetes bacterium]|nr:glycerol kinase [Gemmatimonadota bacterium]